MSGGGISMGAVPDMLMGKDPKKAILDNMKMAAIVGTGMAAAPMMAGSAAAGSAGGSLLGSGTAAGSAAPGLIGSATPMASFMTKAKPFMDAASTGMQVAGSMNQPGEMPPPPQLPQQIGAQTLQQLAQQTQFDAGQEADMRRKMRRGLLGAQ